ncbi:hypothetical protein [Bradyrhizobium sp. 192]|uniref:P-loop ATPase, Sll1717 family n=1 Tax=Bradyrhizobium sp. 192 TaxID=2782660 RepID=UPI001FFF2C1C|nr:hypothetical protein [Bradyrhizobium sp. 192]UPJ55769.1 hypothetical protein IVB24_24310 [Bradyrhizobium sp. 192]
MPIDLRKISNFGGTDADEDSLLLQSFEDHPAYLQVLNHEKFCILGRKGSGKTAIFKKILKDRVPNVFSFGHTFSDYPWHHHDKQKKVGVPEEQCYVQSWNYLCLISLSKILLNQDNSQPFSDETLPHLERIERFVLDTYGSKDPDVTQIFSPAHRLRFSGDVGVDWKIFKASAKIDTVEMANLPSIAQEVNLNLRKSVIECLNPDNRYYVLFDQLDLGFSTTERQYSLRLIGLLLAAKELNVLAKEMGKNLTVGIFLRDDIYRFLRFEDKNKITENFSASVHWDHGPNHRTLKSLMEKRFKAAAKSEEPIRWDEVFDEDHQMTGRQSKYHYMRDRTFLRPRDMIKFCNEALDAFKALPSTSAKFDNPHILEAQGHYSDYLYRELEDEIHKQIPNYEFYVEVLKNLEALQFTKDDFLTAWERRKSLLTGDDRPELAMKQLYDFSLIGFYSPGGGGGGAEYIWKYKDQRSAFNENAAQFRVHSGFKEVLGLKKFVRSG